LPVVRVNRSTLDHVQLRRDLATAEVRVMMVHVMAATKHFTIAYLQAVTGVNDAERRGTARNDRGTMRIARKGGRIT
jgi:hypothetical protein